jgi:hypothetical protein
MIEATRVQLCKMDHEDGRRFALARGKGRHHCRQLVVAQSRWSDHRHERLIPPTSDRSGPPALEKIEEL